MRCRKFESHPILSISRSNMHHQSYIFANLFSYPLNIPGGLISIYPFSGCVLYKKCDIKFSCALKQEGCRIKNASKAIISILWVLMFCSIWKSLTHWFLGWHIGTSVVQVTATDADDPTYGNSARVVYSILQGQPYFSVEPKTGKNWHVAPLVKWSFLSWHRINISRFYSIYLALVTCSWCFSQYVYYGYK